MKAKFLVLFFIFLFSCSSEKNVQPNVVLIYLDDLGYGDVSSVGSASGNMRLTGLPFAVINNAFTIPNG